jgi:ribosomal protein S18 acetylase RimI-like enzyme
MSTSLQPPQQPAPDGAGAPDLAAPAVPAALAALAVLDNPAWAALTGPHRHLAEIVGSAARYQADVSPFTAIEDADDPRAWADLAALVGPGGTFALAGVPELPEGWSTGQSGDGVQLVADTLRDESDPEARRLTDADVPEMLDLVARTKPGPFLPRTIELGAYYGIFRDGRLVAMAGERLRPPGFTEISAVCTDDAHRGQGLATRLVRHVAAGIRQRGDTPFLHAAAVNTRAIRLYQSMGFRLRRSTRFHFVQVPEGAAGGNSAGSA